MPHGKICYLEIPARTGQESAAFYSWMGGRVITPRTEIGPATGAFAVFADPAGTPFGLYEEPART
jgi:predicted enzyme related to lactoylglutathione lyase